MDGELYECDGALKCDDENECDGAPYVEDGSAGAP